jgi:hypothetical protein
MYLRRSMLSVALAMLAHPFTFNPIVSGEGYTPGSLHRRSGKRRKVSHRTGTPRKKVKANHVNRAARGRRRRARLRNGRR